MLFAHLATRCLVGAQSPVLTLHEVHFVVSDLTVDGTCSDDQSRCEENKASALHGSGTRRCSAYRRVFQQLTSPSKFARNEGVRSRAASSSRRSKRYVSSVDAGYRALSLSKLGEEGERACARARCPHSLLSTSIPVVSPLRAAGRLNTLMERCQDANAGRHPGTTCLNVSGQVEGAVFRCGS